MRITDLFIAGNPDAAKELGIHNGLFVNTSTLLKKKAIRMDGAIAYPGFINSHDHLDFNLFSQLGNRVYTNYREWGKDIRTNNRDMIDAVLQIPEPLRTRWGMYKNLLSGFTTVVNHGKELSIRDPFINVYQGAQSLHSTGFEKNWKWKLNNPLRKKRIVAIHTGEGTDVLSNNEIDQLLRWNLLSKNIIGIHGVAMDIKQAKGFRALVWCPASNYFLLEKTAAIQELKKHTVILFGSDSTLTADWDIWKHFISVPAATGLTKEELYSALTINAAEQWGLHNTGIIGEGRNADLVIVKNNSLATDQFLSHGGSDILMVIQNGKIRMFDETLLPQLAGGQYIDINHFSKIYIHNQYKYVYGDIAKLTKETQAFNPGMPLPIKIDPVDV